jgi:hypothetical protein
MTEPELEDLGVENDPPIRPPLIAAIEGNGVKKRVSASAATLAKAAFLPLISWKYANRAGVGFIVLFTTGFSWFACISLRLSNRASNASSSTSLVSTSLGRSHRAIEKGSTPRAIFGTLRTCDGVKADGRGAKASTLLDDENARATMGTTPAARCRLMALLEDSLILVMLVGLAGVNALLGNPQSTVVVDVRCESILLIESFRSLTPFFLFLMRQSHKKEFEIVLC